MNDRSPLNESRRSRRATLALMAFCCVLLAFVLGRVTGPETPDASPSPQDSPVPEASPQPEDLDLGAERFARTESGAAAAATSFAQIMSSITPDHEAFVEATEAVATPAWRAEARRLALNGIEFVTESYGAAGSTSFAPVRYRVSAFDQDQATVEVWGVTLAGRGSLQQLDELWATARIELSWTSEGWRVSGGSSSAGPTPARLPSDGSKSLDQLEGYREYRHGPRP